MSINTYIKYWILNLLTVLDQQHCKLWVFGRIYSHRFNVCMSTNFRYKVPVYVLITEDAEEDWSMGVRH